MYMGWIATSWENLNHNSKEKSSSDLNDLLKRLVKESIKCLRHFVYKIYSTYEYIKRHLIKSSPLNPKICYKIYQLAIVYTIQY